MASNLVPFRPTGICACSSSGNRKSDTHHRKPPSPSWWTPIFGWSSNPGYIDSITDDNDKSSVSAKAETGSESDLEPKNSRSRFAPGCLTAEKAKQLRLMTTKTETFHDVMYHSAIASRLASDFSTLSDS